MSCKRKLIDRDDNCETSQRTPKRQNTSQDRLQTPQYQRLHQATTLTTQDDLSVRKVIDEFIYLYEMLDNTDDGEVKPNYSYTELVFLAIMRSPNFCLPIHEIYRYIDTRFSYFTNPRREHWKNAVRHSLSKTRCFSKIGVDSIPRKSGILNRSCYLWSVIPRSIVKFARGEYRPSGDSCNGTNTLRWAFQRVDAQQFWEFVAMGISRRTETLRYTLNNCTNPTRIFEVQICKMPQKEPKRDTLTPGQIAETGEWWNSSAPTSHSTPRPQSTTSVNTSPTPTSQQLYSRNTYSLPTTHNHQLPTEHAVSCQHYTVVQNTSCAYTNSSCSYYDSGIDSYGNDSGVNTSENSNPSAPTEVAEPIKIKQEFSPSRYNEMPIVFANLDHFPSCPDFPALSPVNGSNMYLPDNVPTIYSQDLYSPMSFPHAAYVCSSPIVADDRNYLPCMFQREMPNQFPSPVPNYRPYYEYSELTSRYHTPVSSDGATFAHNDESAPKQ